MSDPTDDRAEIDLRIKDPAALEDQAALEEIELYSELMIVAGASPRPLTAEEIDQALGVRASRLAGPADLAAGRAQ